jgi:hypothetical protein
MAPSLAAAAAQPAALVLAPAGDLLRAVGFAGAAAAGKDRKVA